jgi:PAS domain-containing protein
MWQGRVGRPALAVLRSGGPQETWTWFCAYCGAPHHGEEPPSPMARVCRACGLGMLIEAPGPVSPGPRDAFLVVDHELRVQAVSRRAERLLSVRETVVVGSELTDLLLPIDSDAQGSGLLTDAAFGATGAERMPVPAHLVLRATTNPALILRARIGRCGPSLAALIVLAPSPSRAVPARGG